MADHIKKTISDLRKQIQSKEDEIRGIKSTVNTLCKMAGQPAIYGEAELQPGGTDLVAIQDDSFYGQPLNTSIRRILEMRRAAGVGPAAVREIYDALKQGGYEFHASNDENAMRGLRISLGKSTQTFHKLPNGSFGLLEWYPAVKDKRGSRADEPEPEPDETTANIDAGQEGSSNEDQEGGAL